MGALAACRAENTRVRGGSGPDPSTVQLPVATTGTPTNVTWLGAMLNGVVNGYDQAVSVSWEYGTTTAYGKTTPTQNLGASGANQNVQAQIIGLTSTTTYHCRIRATNAAGQAYGQDVTFTTQAVGGAVPSVVGTPPVVSATFESDIAYDPISGFVTATLNGTVDAGSHAHATSYQFFLRRMDGIDVWHAINNPGTTSSTSPIAVSAYLGYILVTDADYEWYLSATNVKGTVTSVPILSFHTPAAPPPPGSPPTANTLSTANVTSTTALVTAEVNNVNTLAGTGSTNAWLRYKTGSAPLSATDYTTQVGPINLSPLTGNVVQQLPYTLTQLNSSVTYYVWAYAANPYGEADDWGSPLNFTTTAPSQLGTISVTTDPNWVAYGQATVFCTYTTPVASGPPTYSIRFGYRESGIGGGYTYTSYENVPYSLATATWDCVIGGLTHSKQYDIIAELYDGSQAVQSSQGGVITTAQSPSNLSAAGYTSNFPGFGPGSRGSPFGPLGVAPTLNDIPTYADPRRPSSGLISRSNPRLFKSNISADPVNGPTNAAAFAAYLANDGYDIVVYGLNHAVGGRTTYDIELWNPRLCAVLATAMNIANTVPLIVPNGTYVDLGGATKNGHGKGSNALVHALKAYSRWGDVVGIIGTFGGINMCGASSASAGANAEVAWITQLNNGRVIVGVSVRGINALGGADQPQIGGVGVASRLGSFTNCHFTRARQYVSDTNPVNQGSATNGGNNTTGWVFSACTGLWGLIDLKVEANPAFNNGFGAKWFMRTQSKSVRFDVRNCQIQHLDEHDPYWDNPSPYVSGVENGEAAPSFFMGCSKIAGLTTGKNGNKKCSVQIVGRRLDNNASSYPCPTGCGCAGNCGNNQSIGPDGAGPLYFLGNTIYTDPANNNGSDYSFVGHQGPVIVSATNAKAPLQFGIDAACCKILRPYQGPDGQTYATAELIVETYETTLTTMNEALVKIDGVARVEIQNLSAPALFNKPMIILAAKQFQPNYNGTDLQPSGFVKITMANPLSGWAGWPAGGKIWWAWALGNPQTNGTVVPPLIGKQYTDAEIDVFYTGVCRDYLYAPLTQPGGFQCPNSTV